MRWRSRALQSFMIVKPGDGLERPVVGGQVAGLAADHAGQLELVSRAPALPRGAQTSALVADHARRVREVEDRHLVPLRHHVEPALAPAGRDVLLERVEVADAGDRGQGRLMAASSGDSSQSVPRRACSRSIASNSALKFPLPKLRAPRRWMISKKSVGRSSTGLVKIWSR